MPDLELIRGGRAAAWWVIEREIHLLPLDRSVPDGHRSIPDDAKREGPYRRLADAPDLEGARFCEQCWREAYRRSIMPFGPRQA